MSSCRQTLAVGFDNRLSFGCHGLKTRPVVHPYTQFRSQRRDEGEVRMLHDVSNGSAMDVSSSPESARRQEGSATHQKATNIWRQQSFKMGWRLRDKRRKSCTQSTGQASRGNRCYRNLDARFHFRACGLARVFAIHPFALHFGKFQPFSCRSLSFVGLKKCLSRLP